MTNITKENKIEKIYEVIAEKESVYTTLWFEESNKPVMIWDVLDYWDWLFNFSNHPKTKHIKHNTKRSSSEDVILELWKLKRLPIEEQSELCISYIYDLIKTKKNIERYIQFAIDNGYDEFWGQYNWAEEDSIYLLTDLWPTTISIYWVITSKKFIEAVCSGIQEKLTNDCEIDILINSRFYDHKNFEKYLRDETDLLDDLTTEQAIAIRNNELGEFINNLLWDA
jgi:hypothetical protein